MRQTGVRIGGMAHCYRLQQFADTIQRNQTLQVGGEIAECQHFAGFTGGTLPCEQGGDGRGVDHSQITQVDLSLTIGNCAQTGIEHSLRIIEGERQGGTKRHVQGAVLTPLAGVAARRLFFSASVLIKPSIPPLLISLAKLPL